MMVASTKPVGAYYMPNWDQRPNDPRIWRRNTWTPLLQQFPKLMPLKAPQGYDETQQSVMDQSIREAVWGGLTFFNFDTFFDHNTGNFTGDHAQKNFVASKETGLQFSMALDTRNDEKPFLKLEDWERYWDVSVPYLDDPRHLKRNGRRVWWLISFDHFFATVAPMLGEFLKDGSYMAGKYDVPANTPNRVNAVVKSLLQIAKDRTGYDLYTIAGIGASEYWMWMLDLAGFDGHSFYNMSEIIWNAPTIGPKPNTYAELDANYRTTYASLLRLLKRPSDTSGTELWVCMTAGWDARTLANGRYVGRPTAEEWEAHLSFFRALGDLEDKIVGYCIDAWNEHTEGSVLEPIVLLGRMMLSKLKKWFG